MIYEQIKQAAKDSEFGSLYKLNKHLGYKTANNVNQLLKRQIKALNETLELIGYELGIVPIADADSET